MTDDDTSWLEDGCFSTPQEAAYRLRVTEETVRAWARAGFIRHLAEGRPLRFLLCDDDIDELADLLQNVKHPTLAVLRVLKTHQPKQDDSDQRKHRPPTAG